MVSRSIVVTSVLAALVVASCATATVVMTVNTTAADAPQAAPQFDVDPAWPKPLPNRWLMGQAAGVAVDGHGHIWVIFVVILAVLDVDGAPR